MRNIKEIMRDARMGLGPFNMTALEIIRYICATVPKTDWNMMESFLILAMEGKAQMCGRPVKVVG